MRYGSESGQSIQKKRINPFGSILRLFYLLKKQIKKGFPLINCQITSFSCALKLVISYNNDLYPPVQLTAGISFI